LTTTQRSTVDTSKQLQVSRVVDAPAEKIFALLVDPNRHPEIDGAGMLRGTEGDTPSISGVGQRFTMIMQAPGLGDYRVINTVTAYMPGARIGWGPRLDPTCELAKRFSDMETGGHTYTYDLREVEGGTEITQTYEWMSVKDPQFEAMCPFVSQEQMAATLNRITDVFK
jgi:uncharacterized protein YndB with AHSA1/START domain